MNIRIAAALTGATLSLATVAGVAAASSATSAEHDVSTFDAQERVTICEILEDANLPDSPQTDDLLEFFECDDEDPATTTESSKQPAQQPAAAGFRAE